MPRRADNTAVVFVTCANEEQGAGIARVLVSERLAACVNLIGSIRSIYRWREKIEDDRETLILIKTRTALLQKVEKRVRELHTYEVPEIMALRFHQGSAPYVDWLLDSTSTRRKAAKR